MIAISPAVGEDETDFDEFLRNLSFGSPVDNMDDGLSFSVPDEQPGSFSETNDLGVLRLTPFGGRDRVEVLEQATDEADEAVGLDPRRRLEDQEPEKEPKRATIRALEKITARITDLDIDVGNTTRFKSLMITVRTCYKRPPEETPETTAFLEVIEQKPSGEIEPIFTGWMFASSPGLSALEHPVYDVWIMDCKTLGPVRSAVIE